MSYVVCRWALDEEEKFRILPFSNATFVRSRNQLRNNIEKENENEKKKKSNRCSHQINLFNY